MAARHERRGHRRPPGIERRWVPGVPGQRGLRLGLGGIIVLFVLSLVLKESFFALLDTVPMDTSMTGSAPSDAPVAATREENERFEFVKFVLNDVQNTWAKVLPQEGDAQYLRSTLADEKRGLAPFLSARRVPSAFR